MRRAGSSSDTQSSVHGLSLAVDRLSEALVRSTGRALFVSLAMPDGPLLKGRFEVRDSRGRVKRLQEATLPLPQPLFLLSGSVGAPSQMVRIETRLGLVTLWPVRGLVELQVGYRWNGFSGKPIVDWDERFVVFAELEGDPLALRIDEVDGPVWWAPREEGAFEFLRKFPSLEAFLSFAADEVEGGAATSLSTL